MTKMVPRILTIAGSDSSGGAGIEADLKTITTHGCYGMTCITALTAQNTCGVKRILPVSDQSFIETTLDAVYEDVGVDVVKTGMLSSCETVKTVARKLRTLHSSKPLIVDTVMVSTSGAELTEENATRTFIEELFPLATLITPNIPEAVKIANELSSGINVPNDVNEMKELATLLGSKSGCNNVLLKGGHIATTQNQSIVDILYLDGQIREISHPVLDSSSTHGTGCTLSAAIASNIGKGMALDDSVVHGVRFIHKAIASAEPLGQGHGPVNHLFNVSIRPFVENHFVDWLLAHPKVRAIWSDYVDHQFVVQLSHNTLRLENFKFFLRQDYKYLEHYARAHGLAAYKAPTLEATGRSAGIIRHIQEEMKLHIDYCKSFGLSVDDLKATQESLACYAYSRFILDIGGQEDWLALQIALSPCLFGYYAAAKNRLNDPKSVKDGNPYWKWVDNYVAEDYLQAVQAGQEILEAAVLHVSNTRLEELVDTFVTAIKMEIAFWSAALNLH